MGHEIEADYAQAYLFPRRLEEWVGPNHPARMVRDVVAALDLDELGFTQHSLEGRPPYGRRLLLRAWLYGYMERVRTSRRLEKACTSVVGFLWLVGTERPDHNTLWRFFRDNRGPLLKLFKGILQLAAKAGATEAVLHAVDGTKLAAAASRHGVWGREQVEKLLAGLDEAVEEIAKQAEAAESADQGWGEHQLPVDWREKVLEREELREMLGRMKDEEVAQMSKQEMAARLMKGGRQPGLQLGYNAQVVVDAKSGMIVAQGVSNEQTDHRQLIAMLEEVKENLGQVAEQTVADGGYHSAEVLAEAEERGYEVLVNEGAHRAPGPEVKGAEFHSSRFSYDAEKDCVICPRGKELVYKRTRAAREDQLEQRVYQCESYRECPVRWQCSKSKQGRIVEIGPHYQATLAQRRKQQQPGMRELLRRRQGIVEKVFGTIKERDGFRRFTMRGLEGVRAQWAMVCTAWNLRKLYAVWRAGELVAPA
jgi:transposase